MARGQGLWNLFLPGQHGAGLTNLEYAPLAESMYQGISDTDFDKYTEDAVTLFRKYGIDTVFANLEGFPADWKTNVPAFIRFVREHQCASFLEYGEYPYATADEIKKALRVKAALAGMLDEMQ